MVDRAELMRQYASVDAAMADQRRFDSISLVSELFAAVGAWGLHAARTRSDVEYLLRQGAPVDGLRLIDWADGHQHWETPLVTACVDHRWEVATALIDNGAVVDAPNMIVAPGGSGFGHTAIHTLTTSGDVPGVVRLIAAGANVNRQTTLGWTPLHFAAQKDNPEMTATLLQAGAEPGIGDLDGERPTAFAGRRTRHLLDVTQPWNVPSEDTKSICFPATDPPDTLVLLHANMVHDFIAVGVEHKLVAVLPTGARRQIEFIANGLEKAEGYTYTLEIPCVGDASMGALTLWCSSIANTVSLRDERNRPFAGFGEHRADGSRLLRSLLG